MKMKLAQIIFILGFFVLIALFRRQAMIGDISGNLFILGFAVLLISGSVILFLRRD